MSQNTGDMPSTEGPPSAGRNQPHVDDCSTPNATRPIPIAQSIAPSTSR